jgi:hypothetical protein
VRTDLRDISRTEAGIANTLGHGFRMASGDARVSGEMRVILTMMLRAKKRGETRTAEKATKWADQSAEEPETASSDRT